MIEPIKNLHRTYYLWQRQMGENLMARREGRPPRTLKQSLTEAAARRPNENFWIATYRKNGMIK